MLVCADVYVCVSLYSSVMNSQLMKEPLLLPVHQPENNYLVSEAILQLYQTTASFSCHVSKNPIYSLPLFLFLPYPFSFHFAPPSHHHLSEDRKKNSSLTTSVSFFLHMMN